MTTGWSTVRLGRITCSTSQEAATVRRLWFAAGSPASISGSKTGVPLSKCCRRSDSDNQASGMVAIIACLRADCPSQSGCGWAQTENTRLMLVGDIRALGPGQRRSPPAASFVPKRIRVLLLHRPLLTFDAAAKAVVGRGVPANRAWGSFDRPRLCSTCADTARR